MMVLYYIGVFLFLIICALLCLVVLVQESKSMGLGASFGGDSGESLFGTSTADILKKVTAWLACIFLGACVLFSAWSSVLGKPQPKIPATIEEEA